MIFTHQVMMFKNHYYIHQTNTRECAFYTLFLLWKCVPFRSDLNYDSIRSMVVKFQLYAPLFFSKPTECNCSIFTGFYAYTKLNHIVGFLSICFQKQRQGSFEKNEKQKAMVLVIAKMNMKAHFIKFCENACIYQSE